MSPVGSPRLTYWSSAGALFSRSGPLSPVRSLELLIFYGRLALACRRQGDREGACFCAGLFSQLAAALISADDWRRAALGGPPDPAIAPLRALRR